MHYTSDYHGAWDEDFVESRDSAITDANLKTRVKNTLLYDSPQWDGVGNWGVDLWPATSYCDAMNPGPIDDVEIRFWASSYWSYCGPDPQKDVSCVFHAAYEGGHYRYADVWTDSQTVNGSVTPISSKHQSRIRTCRWPCRSWVWPAGNVAELHLLQRDAPICCLRLRSPDR